MSPYSTGMAVRPTACLSSNGLAMRGEGCSIFDFWQKDGIGSRRMSEMDLDNIPAHGCRLLRICLVEEKPAAGRRYAAYHAGQRDRELAGDRQNARRSKQSTWNAMRRGHSGYGCPANSPPPRSVQRPFLRRRKMMEFTSWN